MSRATVQNIIYEKFWLRTKVGYELLTWKIRGNRIEGAYIHISVYNFALGFSAETLGNRTNDNSLTLVII